MAVPTQVRASLGRARRAVGRRRHGVVRALHPDPEGLHLVREPVFVLSPVRSGSTLLRSILNAHRAVCAPHELHLATMQVSTERSYAADAWEALGLSVDDLSNVLWDRALHLNLVRSGKRIVVDKTPQNARHWQRIHSFWPDAKYLHLHRHPAVILASMQNAQQDVPTASHIRNLLSYGRDLDAAREALPGPTVRYEDLSTDPEATMRTVCSYLGIRFQPGMLRYRSNHSRSGLGDWSEKIRSGRVQPHAPLPAIEDVPEQLRSLTRRWGY
jgi:LPS sulfotransferase NodH